MTKVFLWFVQKVSLKNQIANIGKFIPKQKHQKVTSQTTGNCKYGELVYKY